MLSSILLWAAVVPLFTPGVTANLDWLEGLPNCWQNCLANTDGGCSSTKCVCQTSENSAPYLPDAVSCAVYICHADQWSLDLVLGSLSLYCLAIEYPVPDKVMSSALAVAGGESEPSPQTTAVAKSSAVQYKSTKSSNDVQGVTTTLTAVITQTTTDAKGNTLQVVVPLILGPGGISTGNVVTSTVQAATTTTSSTPASTSSTARAAGSTSTQRASSTSPSSSRQTTHNANGNGSPFDNMQAGADHLIFSSAILGSGLLGVLLMVL